MLVYVSFGEMLFEKSIQEIKLKENFILFMDGIDVRPESIPYEEYVKCIQGLAEASWSLNTELFQNVRDSKGKIRIVLLLRPDIYESLNLQNAFANLTDNSVYLNWTTTYTDYKNSYLYKIALKLLSYGQETSEYLAEDIFEKYFKWQLYSKNTNRNDDTAFISFLRISLSRPRDILTIFDYLQKIMNQRNMGNDIQFSQECYESDKFQNSYSEYFVSSLKDQLSFYYTTGEFDTLRKMFSLFDSIQFNYDEYQRVYNEFFNNYISGNDNLSQLFYDSKKLLQLLYAANVIFAIEEHNGAFYYSFSYREKSYSNINPQIPIGKNIKYGFHYGMYKKSKRGRF